MVRWAREHLWQVLYIANGLLLVGLAIQLSGLIPRVLALAIQLVLLGLFYKKRQALFAPALYLILMQIMLLIPLVMGMWVLNLLLAISAFFALRLVFASVRQTTARLKWGKVDKITMSVILITIFVSALALIIWYLTVRPDVAAFLAAIPAVPPSQLWALVFGFGILNAFAEEMTFRGIFWAGLEMAEKRPIALIVWSSIFFGICHYHGFPGGPSGVLLAFLYGCILGYLRYRSGGLFAPITAHLFADITIAVVLLRSFDLL